MDQIMKVNNSIMKPTGELTLYLGEEKNPTVQVSEKTLSHTAHSIYKTMWKSIMW